MQRISRNFSKQANPFESLKTKLTVGGKTNGLYSLSKLGDSRVEKLPYSVRVLLESAIRNCDNFSVTEQDVEKILNWKVTNTQDVEIPFKPARVLLQDFTGVPAVVDLAAMRDAVAKLGVNPMKINPQVPVDLVIDHSVQVDDSRNPKALENNNEIEFNRNYERFEFLKWGQNAFENFQIVPPGSGIVHQVNLEYLARVVMERDGLLYPDSVVGTDSHTTMINGLGVVGWGVGGIEAEAVMLGQHISMVLPQVVGFKLTGKLRQHVTATDLVLTVTQMLRKRGVVGKFVEFFGEGCSSLSLADRATIANMGPEYGATIGYFPVDGQTINYLKLSGRDQNKIDLVTKYLKEQNLFRDYSGANPEFSGEVLNLDLGSVEPCLSGPKRPHDRVNLSDMKTDFTSCLTNPVGFKGYGLKSEEKTKTATFNFGGKSYTLNQGALVIAAITSCTNTSNPGVMLAAGLLAKNAVEKGLKVLPYIKTSLSPGSGVVTEYFNASGVQKYLEQLGFYTAGYGCMTCIGNSGELDPEVHEAIQKSDIVASAVLSGNRNFEGRVHPLTRANYLASPPLVVAYALAGTVDFDFEKQPLGKDKDGKNVFLKDIWPSNDSINSLIEKSLKPEMFKRTYDAISKGTPRWNALKVSQDKTYNWKEESTYIHNPPFFQGLGLEKPVIKPIKNAYCLLNVGDSITTDHISPAGKIANNSPAARYLKERGVEPKDFNTYGARRGNDEIMARGTFANTRLINKMIGNNEASPQTIHVPTGERRAIFDAASEYILNGQPTIVLAGKEYGSGSSRDWAAKGPYLQGIKAVIAQSFERIHRSNLVGMGILPLEFNQGESADSHGLTGFETFNIEFDSNKLEVNQSIKVTTSTGKSFTTKSRLDTAIEIEYFKNGGILHYVLRNMANSK